MGKFDRNLYNTALFLGDPGATASAFALNTQYTYGSAGRAIGIRFQAHASVTLNKFYFFQDSHAGSSGITTIELRNDSGTLPGATLIASTTVAAGTTDAVWKQATLSASLTAGTTYWLILGCAAADAATNSPTPMHLGTLTQQVVTIYNISTFTSTNGFTSKTTLNLGFNGLITFSDGTVLGSVYTAQTTDTSNSRERGFRIDTGSYSFSISAMHMNATTSVSGMKIYTGSTAPGGSATYTLTIDQGFRDAKMIRFAPFTFAANTTYRVVLTYSANSTAPGNITINDYSTFADIQSASLGGGLLQHTIDDGAGGWTDTPAKLPKMEIFVSDISTGGGGGLLRPASMSGGF